MVRGIPSISSFGFSIFLTTMSNVGEEFLCRATATRSVFASGLRGDVEVKSRRNYPQSQLAVNKENVMKVGITRLIVVAAIAAVVVVAGRTAAWAQCPASFTAPSYSPDFSNTSDQACLTLNGNYNGSTNTAYPAFVMPEEEGPTVLRLTPNAGGWATSAWFDTQQSVAFGFSTTFTFRISDSSVNENADGFAFLVQNSTEVNGNGAPIALGYRGCGVGFGYDPANDGCSIDMTADGIPNSVAVEFKTYDDGYPTPYPNTANSVSIMNNGTAANCIDSSCAIAANNSLQVAGAVTTSGTTVTWVSGSQFNPSWTPGTAILINGVSYSIASVASTTSLSVTTTLTTYATPVQYSVGAPVAGTVTTTGTNTVTWASGSYFNPAWDVGTQILINGVAYTITSGPTGETATTATTLTVTPDPPAFAAAPYSVGIILDDGNVHTATITYTPTPTASASPNCIVEGNPEPCLDVILDGVDLFNGGVLFNMTTIGLASSTNAWVGFTGGNAGGNDDEDILNWVFTPQGQSQSGMVNPGASSPTVFNFDGGFTPNNPSSGYDYTIQLNSGQPSEMVVTAMPQASQAACNLIVDASFPGADCFVVKNGGGLGVDVPVMFEVTCPGSPGTCDAAFYATLGSDFAFTCTENSPLGCGPLPANFTFGFPNLTSISGLPEVGFLKGAGPDPNHPCTQNPGNSPALFQSNQISAFTYIDGQPGAMPVKGSSGGSTSCWVVTYETYETLPGEVPTVSITAPVNGGTYHQNEQDSTTLANYTCAAVNAGSSSPTGPYLTVASCTAIDTPGGSVANGAQFDTTTLGSHTFTVSVMDSATNTNSSTVTYNVVQDSNAAGLNGKNCNGFYTGTYNGNLTVSSGQSCTFTKGGVTGNLTQTGGTVVLENSSFVKGNLQTSSGILSISNSSVSSNLQITGGSLSIGNSSVGGNLQITGGGTFSIGPTVSIGGDLQIQNLPASPGTTDQVCGASVKGDLTFQNNGTAVLIGGPGCAGNAVGGNLTVQNNTASTTIDTNKVGGNLADQNNTAATVIDSNTVNGNLTDQNNTVESQVFNNAVTANLQCSGDSAITGGGNTAKSKKGQCATF